MLFRFIKIFFVTLVFINFSILGSAKDAPSSFADLAEKLMPSVVNISTSQTIVTRSNPFPVF